MRERESDLKQIEEELIRIEVAFDEKKSLPPSERGDLGPKLDALKVRKLRESRDVFATPKRISEVFINHIEG